MNMKEAQVGAMDALYDFCKAVYPDFEVFDMSYEWPERLGRTIGMQVLTPVVSREPVGSELDDDDYKVSYYQMTQTLQVMSYRDGEGDDLDPLFTLSNLQMLMSDEEVLYKFFRSKGIALQSFTPPSRADIIKDTESRELRARMTVTFNVITSVTSLVQSVPLEAIQFGTVDPLDMTNITGHGIKIYEPDYKAENLKFETYLDTSD